MKLVICPYKIESTSAKLLAKALEVKRIKGDSKTFKPKNKLILNWGNSTEPNWLSLNWINYPSCVAVASNKLATFEALQGIVSTPDWATDHQQAVQWALEGHTIVVRHTLTGHSGQGIQLCQSNEEIPLAPLYVKYKKKAKEFRVHVFNDETIDIQEKRKDKDNLDPNYKIRSHANGWIFCRENIVEPEDLRATTITTIKELGLTFGAVDVIFNQKENKCYILEVNTAPGLEGITLEKYTDAILKYKNKIEQG